MKIKILIVFLLCLISSDIFAESLTPGTYRYKKNQNEAKIKITGDQASLTAWNVELKCLKTSPSKYSDKATTDFIEVISKDEIIVGNEKYGSKDELVLYAPDDYKSKDGLTDFVLDGERYFAIPDNENKKLVGEYLTEGKGDPKVELKSDKTGYFQRHQVSPSPIVWWGIETNYKGEIQKLTGENGNYKMILVVKYGAGSSYDKAGSFGRMQIVVSPSAKKTIIMGERIYSW